MEDLSQEVSHILKESLLTDDYGGWKKMNPIFLQTICDQVGDITKILLNQIEHRECNNEINFLRNELDRTSSIVEKQRLTIDNIEKVITTSKEKVGG